MSEAEFKKYQESLKKSYLEEVKNLSQEFNRIWSHIQSSHYNFEQNELDAAKVEEITLQEAINFYEMKIHPSATLRRKVSSHLQRQKSQMKYEENHEIVMKSVSANSITFNDLAEIRDLKKTGTLAGLPSVDISKFTCGL